MKKTKSILKKLFAGLVIVIALAIISLLVITKLIDDKGIKEIIAARIYEYTGKELQVRGKVETYMFPSPHVMLTKVRLGDLFAADSIDIKLSTALLYTGGVEIRGITLNKPKLLLEKTETGNSWDLSNESHEALKDNRTGINIGSLTVVNGSIEYVDQINRKSVALDNITLVSDIDGLEKAVTLRAETNINKVPFHFNITADKLSALYLPAQTSPIEIVISQDEKSKFTFKGTANLHSGVKGDVSLETDHLQRWQTLIESMIKRNLVVYDVDEKSKDEKKHAVLTTKMEMSDKGYKFNNTNFEVGNSKGTLELGITKEKENYNVDLNVAIDELHKEEIVYFVKYLAKDETLRPVQEDEDDFGSISPQAGEDSVIIPKDAETRDFEVIAGLPKNIDAYIDITAKNFVNEGKKINDIKIAAQMVEGEIVISQAVAQFPGESQTVAFGLIKKGYQGLTFDGSIESAGKSFRDAVAPLLPKLEIPKKGLGTFKAKSNVYISSKEIRFSEMDTIVESSRATGALIIYFEDIPKVDSAIHLYSIDFDKLIGSTDTKIIPDLSKAAVDEFSEQARPLINVEWLKNIGVILTSKIEIDYYQALGKIGKKATLGLTLQDNFLRFSDIKADYNNHTIAGNFELKSDTEIPNLSLKLNMDRLNLSDYVTLPLDFEAKDEKEAAKKKKEIFAKTLSLPELQLFNGDVNLSIGTLTYKDFLLPKFKFKGTLTDGMLTSENLSTEVWGGKLDTSLNVVGGAVPAMSATFILTTVDIAEFLKIFTPINNISGKLSLTGSLSLTGINIKSMLATATGNMTVAARDITVGQFDLPGIIKAVATVRSVADIVNVARLALPGGRTDFYAVDGALVIKEGIAEIPGIVARTQLSDASIKGKLNFFEEAIDLLINFNLVSLADKDLPTLGMKLTGPIVDPQIILDTKSLEEYVAKKTTNKILQRENLSAPKVQQ